MFGIVTKNQIRKAVNCILEEDYLRRNKDLDKSNEFNQMLGEASGFAALYAYLDLGDGKELLKEFEQKAIYDRFDDAADQDALTKFTSVVMENN